MVDPIRALLAEMADALDHDYQCLMDDRRLTHPLADRARAAMRPKPPSLAEQALAILDDSRLDAAHENCIRRALERLAELEGLSDG